MDRREPAMLPDRQMDVSDVTESDDRLGIGTQRLKIELIGDPIRTRTTSRGHDGAYPAIPNRIVHIGRSIEVASSHRPPPVHRVTTHLRTKPPSLQHLD